MSAWLRSPARRSDVRIPKVPESPTCVSTVLFGSGRPRPSFSSELPSISRHTPSSQGRQRPSSWARPELFRLPRGVHRVHWHHESRRRDDFSGLCCCAIASSCKCRIRHKSRTFDMLMKMAACSMTSLCHSTVSMAWAAGVMKGSESQLEPWTARGNGILGSPN